MASADRQKREREQLRAKILDGARKIIQDEGYDALTIRKIATRIEYSPMALYNHFPDKISILLALGREVFEQLETALPKAGKDPVATLRKALQAYMEFGMAHQEEYQLVFMTRISDGQGEHSEKKDESDRLGGRRAFERLIGYVQACIDGGKVKGEAFPIATALWAGIHGAVSLQITQTHFPFGPRKGFEGSVISVLLRGIEAR